MKTNIVSNNYSCNYHFGKFALIFFLCYKIFHTLLFPFFVKFPDIIFCVNFLFNLYIQFFICCLFMSMFLFKIIKVLLKTAEIVINLGPNSEIFWYGRIFFRSHKIKLMNLHFIIKFLWFEL